MRRSIRTFVVILEIAALAAVSLSLFLVFYSVREGIRSRYIKNGISDIEKIEVLFNSFYENSQKSFEEFSGIRGNKTEAALVLVDFSDIYEVDPSLKITVIHRREKSSNIFPGYDFSGSRLSQFLAGAARGAVSVSAMFRSPESDSLGMYFAVKLPASILVGRIGMDRVKEGLAKIARYSGGAILIASKDGYILSSTMEPFPVSVLPESWQTILKLDKEYIYVRKRSDSIDNDIAMLMPLSEIDSALNELWRILPFVFILLFSTALGKVAFLHFFLFKPLDRFVDILSSWEIDSPKVRLKPYFMRWAEIGSLHRTFEEMSGRLTIGLSEIRAKENEIRKLNESLERKVIERMKQLETANQGLVRANEELSATLANLEKAQDKLVQSEKMAALGQLVAGIAHELNTPLGAIVSANTEIKNNAAASISGLPEFIASLGPEDAAVFASLAEAGVMNLSLGAGAELRKTRNSLAAVLREAGSPNAESISDDLADIGIDRLSETEQKVFSGSRGIEISSKLYSLAGISRSSDIIEKAAGKASNFVKALRDYSHQNKYGEPKSIDLAAQIETILTLYYPATKRGVKVVRDIRLEGPILGYPERLEQVWINLFNNALYAMDYSGELRVEARTEGEDVLVSVIDSGPGIPDEVKPNLFKPFFTTKPRGEGSGIGLELCRKIVELHKGSIWFESVPGKTAFTVRLPVRAVPEGSTQ